MPDDDDTAGLPIPPSELSRIVGDKFISTTQLHEHTGLNKAHTEAVIDVLVQHELFVPWLAARCPNCRFVWPYCKTEDEDSIESKVFCPLCNKHTPSEYVDFYEVYQIIKMVE